MSAKFGVTVSVTPFHALPSSAFTSFIFSANFASHSASVAPYTLWHTRSPFTVGEYLPCQQFSESCSQYHVDASHRGTRKVRFSLSKSSQRRPQISPCLCCAFLFSVNYLGFTSKIHAFFQCPENYFIEVPMTSNMHNFF